MSELSNLKIKLSSMLPQHDTPLGLLHPYWARKPMNIISEIIQQLSKPGDLILDPFMGSGTTIFSGLINNRSVFGSDINPLSVFIVKSIMKLNNADTDLALKEADEFLKDLSDHIHKWFYIKDEDMYIERERFVVNGKFEYGKFSLTPIEIIAKKKIKNNYFGRYVLNKSDIDWDIKSRYLYEPINFSKINLTPNSRIAIPKGAKLSDFYTKRNQAAINYALEYINKRKIPEDIKNILKFLLSSSMPLLRLSDKKASSQWPYWRPKNLLTSRNPEFVLKKKIHTFKSAINWISENPFQSEILSIDKFKKSNRNIGLCIEQIAIQDLMKLFPKGHVFDLILTDPPYSDHIPYLEYSALWISIFGLDLPTDALRKEIVKTNSPQRTEDSQNFLIRLLDGFEICCKLLKHDGYLVWFYQDYDLKNWSKISKVALKNNLKLCEIIPVPKQRRSIKTVTSPGSTLDGDLICIFRKSRSRINSENKFNLKDFLKKSSFINSGLFNRYAFIIEYGLKNNCIDDFSNIADSIKEIICKF